MAEIVTSVKRWVSRVHVSTPIQVASSEPCHCVAPSGETRQSQRARVHWLSMLSWAAEISDKAACRGGVLGPSWTWLEGLRCFEGDSLGIFIFLVKLLVYCCLKCHFGFGRCSHCPGFCFSSGWGSPLMPCSACLLSRVFGVQLGADRVVTVLLRSLLDSYFLSDQQLSYQIGRQRYAGPKDDLIDLQGTSADWMLSIILVFDLPCAEAGSSRTTSH